ncbi:PPOX class F420-dependent oxidoreductase [Actinopolymorpha singaporensis]|uniref:Pyridoxamine 5'-phosphate oxidase family protein n=1 Tax=Actinopolymorpha singaporensis TaxID=117157 RepID=A0A1H1V702_9ACTN|nr:PPOX class F420-dependent oxidoreductase [Actinopolymorpha singaporensis]SDS80584.1 pyridoxamine 5'-phosphate oxidase family protein [Actinopolymorpha singaporensis]
MSVFTANELAFLDGGERRLGRVATVGPDGMPHVTPTGWSYNAEHDTIDLGGRNVEATKKYRDIRRTGVVAFVVDEVLPPWQPRGIEIRGRGELLADTIRIHPTRVVSWGLESDELTARHARDTGR